MEGSRGRAPACGCCTPSGPAPAPLSVPHTHTLANPADYVQRYARPEQLLGHNPASVNNKSSDDEDGDGDQKMGGDGDEESEGAFLSDSDDEA